MSKWLHSGLFILFMAALIVSQVCVGEASQPEILARADVPNRVIPQAEIRLVRRGAEMVVQSAILPRFPNKVLKKITRSEKTNWPGNPDSDAYVATLEQAFEVYRTQHDRKTTALVIDFVSSADDTRVDFYFASATRNESGIILQPANIWKSHKFSTEYVKKNQEYILIDAFGKEADEHINTLRSFKDTSNGNISPTP